MNLTESLLVGVVLDLPVAVFLVITMAWFSAVSIGLAADVFVAIGLVLFVRADRKYQAEKKARLQAMGLYGPEFVYQPVIVHAEVTVLEPAPAEPEPVQLSIIPEVRAITAGWGGGE
jgi:hypothetical protein